MSTLDLSFPLFATQPVPADHGYLLYAALSDALPLLHQKDGVAIHPIRGLSVGGGEMQLNERSRCSEGDRKGAFDVP